MHLGAMRNWDPLQFQQFQLVPSPGAAFANGQFTLALSFRMGLPVCQHEPGACRLCTLPRDQWGARDLSCTSGGDVTHRHNAVRDLVYEFSRRAHVEPILEKAGVLADPAVVVELRRPADVLLTVVDALEEGAVAPPGSWSLRPGACCAWRLPFAA